MQHVSRRISVIGERMELELNVAGTDEAALERAVFKASKNNTKPPKQKHVDSTERLFLSFSNFSNFFRDYAHHQ